MPYHFEENGPEDDTVLWRFMKLEKFCSLLQSSSLFYASLPTFEDPYEGILPGRYYSRRFWTRYNVKFPGRTLKDYKLDQNHIRKHVGANCWYSSDIEPEFFWKIYSDLDFGIAIKSNVRRLKTAHENAEKKIYIRSVIYEDFLISNLDEFKDFHLNFDLKRAHTKRRHFSQENEIRCLVKLSSPKRGKILFGENIKVNLLDLIEEIIYSPNSPAWFHDVVENLKSKYGYAQIKSSSSSLLD